MSENNYLQLLFDRDSVRAISMVQVYRSRTGTLRGYRLFTNAYCDLEDITAFVCHAIGGWNGKRGTYETRAPYASMDANDLAIRLTRALDIAEQVRVKIL